MTEANQWTRVFSFIVDGCDSFRHTSINQQLYIHNCDIISMDVMDQNTQKQTVKSHVCMKEKGQRSGVCKHQHEAVWDSVLHQGVQWLGGLGQRSGHGSDLEVRCRNS